MIKRQHIMRIIGAVGFCGIIAVFIGNGCSEGFKTWNGNSPSLLSSTEMLGSGSNTSSTIPVIPGTKTVSLVTSNEVLNHLTACAGVAAPSDATIAMYESKKGAISVYGLADTITSPMMMAITSVAGEVCNDLINQEIKLGPRIFQNFNLTASTLPANGALLDAISRLSLSCWGRNQNSTEIQQILDMASSVGATESMASRKSALMICTSMLSSLDALMN